MNDASRLPEEAGRARLDLPLRRPGDDVLARATVPATAACTPSRRRPHLAPSCQEAGVLGILCGIIGTLQATEAIKIMLGKGETLSGRVVTYDSLKMKFREFKLRRDKTCPVCGEAPTHQELHRLRGVLRGVEAVGTSVAEIWKQRRNPTRVGRVHALPRQGSSPCSVSMPSTSASPSLISRTRAGDNVPT